MSSTDRTPPGPDDHLDPTDPVAGDERLEPTEPVDDDDALVDEDAYTTTSGSSTLMARVGAEALGTYLLVLATLGVVLFSPVTGAGTLGMALAAGLALIGAIAGVGHVSGGHFNPLVTLASAVAGRTSWGDLVPYWLSQVIGGVAAGATLFLVLPEGLPQALGLDNARALYTTAANSWGEQSQLWTLSAQTTSFDVMAAFVIELVVAALFAAVVLGAVHRRATRGTAPFAVGLTYAALLLVAAPVTGGSLNPARSTGAALFAESAALGQLWVFWVAPLLGAALAGLIHRVFAAEDDGLVDEVVVEETEEIIVER